MIAFFACSDETILGRAMEAAGLPVVFTRLGVALAMVFVSFPFVVRTMQPVIQVRTSSGQHHCRSMRHLHVLGYAGLRLEAQLIDSLTFHGVG